jgi:hypothetical protein
MATLRDAIRGLAVSLVLLAAGISGGACQTASILPNAKTQFLNANGQPLAGGKVYFCVPNTSCTNISTPSPKTTWQDAFQATPNAQPIVLDSAGSAFIFGVGNYTESVYDSLGNLVWTGFTQAAITAFTAASLNQISASATLGSWWSDIGTRTPYPDFLVRDRLFVDDGALATSSLGAGTSCIPNTRAGVPINTYGDGWPKLSCYSSLYVLSSNGLDAIGGQTATSLQTGVVGAGSNLGVAVIGLGMSDNTVQQETAWGGYFEGQRLADLGWAFGAEIMVGNKQSVQKKSIYGTNNKQTTALQLNCGSQTAATDCSAGLSFVQILGVSGTPHFDRGIVFQLNSVSDQGGGVFDAVNFPNNYRINWWRNNSGADDLQAYIVANDSTPGDQVQSLVFGSAAASTTLNSSNFILNGGNSVTTMTVSSGGAAQLPSFVLARTGTDGFLTDIAMTNQLFTGTAAGDIILKGATNLYLAGGAPGSVVPGIKINSLGEVSLFASAGSIVAGDSAVNVTATQPASPVAPQKAIYWNITSAGSASQPNQAVRVDYNAGYTGSSRTDGFFSSNAVAGTGATLIPASGGNLFVGNDGGIGSAAANTTGDNVGLAGIAATGNVNVGLLGLSQAAKNSATNIGVVGSAINTGSSPVEVGGWFSLNQTTLPTTSAALIADNASQNLPIALWMANGVTVASVNATGGLTATLTNAATTSAVCYNTGIGLFTYDGTLGTCNTSDESLKTFEGPMRNSLDKLVALSHDSHFGYFKWRDVQLGTGRKIGVGAQTVARYFPELVATGDDGLKSLAYDKLTVPIIDALAELKAEFDSYKASHP